MAKEKYPITIDGLIECLTDIKSKCGGNTFVYVNVLGHECVSGLVSVCLDNDMGNDEALVCIETDIEDLRYPEEFDFYTQGEEI